MIEKRRLLAVGGPTAGGKTALAIELAERLGGEIINADSRQVYRGMDIGTAKPSTEDQSRVPHHLLDVVSPDEEFSLALYTRLAHRAIDEVISRGHLPVIVGGTGLFLRAVTAGYSVPEVTPDTALREALEQEARLFGHERLVDRLRAVDPVAAGSIDGRNVRRVIRAIEVSEALGVPFSSLQRQTSIYNSLMVVLEGDRAVLCNRADHRLEAMLAAGFVEEVARLIHAGYGIELPALSALGYREIARHIRGESGLSQALDETRAATHAFIKRQLTWFRAEKTAVRVRIGDAGTTSQALSHVDAWLEGPDVYRSIETGEGC
jgi:tRNA dimethylallyltransferase